MSSLLEEKGIETFCPLYPSRRQWSDRIKVVHEPLLKTYVFVKITEEQRTIVRVTQGVMNFVSRDGKPALLKDRIIQELRKFAERFVSFEVKESPGSEDKFTDPDVELKGSKLYIPMLELVIIGYNQPEYVLQSIAKN